MKAARFDVYGEPDEVVQLVDIDDPGPPGAGQVRVRMLAAPINPADLLLIRGIYGERPVLPHIAGLEGVGRIEAVGTGVEGLAPGTLVLPVPPSNWQEVRLLGAAEVVPLPADIDIEQAAMLKVNPPTAELMLSELVDLHPGEWVVQNAANSAVGHLVVQIARSRGIHTLNLVRREAARGPLAELGADAVLVDDGAAESDELIEAARTHTGGAPVRLGLDAVAGSATERMGALVADGGTIASYGVLSGQSCQLSPAHLIFRHVTLRGFWVSSWFQSADAARVSDLFTRLAGRVAAGELAAPVTARYPLTELGTAIAHAGQEERGGKVLLRMADPA